jgi:platelet-activating factor acetylhydrolase
VRETANSLAKEIHYQRHPHTPSPEVYNARNDQLRIRLWELGLIHDALLKMESGRQMNNLDPNDGEKRGSRTEVLQIFADKMDITEPGKVVWAGHSFGATTMTQFVKHTYYASDSPVARAHDDIDGIEQMSLFSPKSDSEIVKQITSTSVVLLLDMWCLPLKSRATRWLWNKPMPCYDGPAEGDALLAVLSEKFSEWEGNMNDMKKALSPCPTQLDATTVYSKKQLHFFYPEESAHLSQSDFGILFPVVLGRFLKIREPERLLRLNTRAMMQVMRQNGFQVADPSERDWFDRNDEQLPSGTNSSKVSISSADSSTSSAGGFSIEQEKEVENRSQDFAILDPAGKVRGWKPVYLVDAGPKTVEEDTKAGSAEGTDVGVFEELQSTTSN